MTPKQELFCLHYLANWFNWTQAAISAWYSKKTARQIAQENLTKPYINEYIVNKKKEMFWEREDDIYWVVETFQKLRDYWVEMNKKKMKDPTIAERANDKLAKITGMYEEKVKVNADVVMRRDD